MAGDINQSILVGRLVRDAELRYQTSGLAVASFAIAVNRRAKKNEQWVDEASFFDLALFGKSAENHNKYLTKGTQVAIQAELRQNRWEKDGRNFSEVQIVVTNLQLLGSPRGSGQGSQAPHAGGGGSAGGGGRSSHTPPRSPSDDFDPRAYEDDIPF